MRINLGCSLCAHKCGRRATFIRVRAGEGGAHLPCGGRARARVRAMRAPVCDRTQRHQESQALCDALDLLLQCGSLKRRRTGGGGGERAEAAGGAACGATASKVIVALRISPVFPLRRPLHRANLNKAMEESWCP